jgi:hypothetical protein
VVDEDELLGEVKNARTGGLVARVKERRVDKLKSFVDVDTIE